LKSEDSRHSRAGSHEEIVGTNCGLRIDARHRCFRRANLFNARTYRRCNGKGPTDLPRYGTCTSVDERSNRPAPRRGSARINVMHGIFPNMSATKTQLKRLGTYGERLRHERSRESARIPRWSRLQELLAHRLLSRTSDLSSASPPGSLQLLRPEKSSGRNRAVQEESIANIGGGREWVFE
jgi:hypothetical protein